MQRLGFLMMIMMCGLSFAASSVDFVVCSSTYALCTTADCSPAADNPKIVNCRCDVRNGYSASEKPCQQVNMTDKGQEIASRYYPVKGYKVCSNDRTWAYCLDKKCIIDPQNPKKASCACTSASGMGDYVIVTDNNSQNSCDKGIVSSATVQQVSHITEFLENNDNLKPYNIEVTQ